MEAIQAAWRNCEDPERVVVSQVRLDREGDLLKIVNGPDGFGLYRGLVKALLVEWNVPVGVANDFPDSLLLDPLQLPES